VCVLIDSLARVVHCDASVTGSDDRLERRLLAWPALVVEPVLVTGAALLTLGVDESLVRDRLLPVNVGPPVLATTEVAVADLVLAAERQLLLELKVCPYEFPRSPARLTRWFT
jgi:hypothetical protein